jgi:hypothetical protein
MLARTYYRSLGSGGSATGLSVVDELPYAFGDQRSLVATHKSATRERAASDGIPNLRRFILRLPWTELFRVTHLINGKVHFCTCLFRRYECNRLAEI